MGRRSFELTELSAGSPEEVFRLLADGAGWAGWAGPIVPASRWERHGDPAPGGVGAIRVLGRSPMRTRERIDEYDPPRRLGYTVIGGLPARDYQATVDLHPLPGGGTRIVWRGSFTPAIPGAGAPLLFVARRVVGSIARHLAKAAAAR